MTALEDFSPEQRAKLAAFNRENTAALAAPATGIEPALRIQPHSLDAEQELLGAILINNEALGLVRDFLKPEQFFHEVHRRIYSACCTLVDRGEIANPVTLKIYFERDDVIAKAGGTTYLARLAAAATTVINAEDYARVVHDLALRRELIALGEKLVQDGYNPNVAESAPEMIAAVQQAMNGLADAGPGDDIEFVPIYDAVQEGIEESARRQRGDHNGTLTRIPEIDALLGVIDPGDLIYLGGRPSMGKTALGIAIAQNIGAAGEPCLVFSLEMNRRQLGQRVLSSVSGVAYSEMRKVNRLSQDDMNRMVVGRSAFRAMPVTLVEKRSLRLRQIEAAIRRWKRKTGGKFVLIDYLQLVQADERYRGNREAEVAEVSRGLKRIAGDLGVAILCLCQLNRGPDTRDDKRPRLGDLRESGSIEQDADTVMFVFREEYYEERNEPKADTSEWYEWKDRLEALRGVMEVIIPKVRQGEIGTARLWYDAPTNSFRPLSQKAAPDPRQADLAFEPPSHATEFAPLE